METSWRKNYLRYKSFFLNMLIQYRERSDWKAYLEILLSLTTVSVFSVFALKPTIITIAELVVQIEEKKSTVATMDAKILNLSKAQNLYDREGPSIILLTDSVIPTKPNSDVFARQIEALSSKHGITISSVSLGKATIFGKIAAPPPLPTNTPNSPTVSSNKLDFIVSITAPINDYQKIADFLTDFENLRTIPDITNVEVLLTDGKTELDRNIELLISGNLPYLPLE